MSESDLSNHQSSRNGTPNPKESDVREKLTLHVRKRLSGELQVVVKQEQQDLSPTNTETVPRKKSKKSKKKNKNNNEKISKRVRVKEESSPVETGSEEQATTETPEVSDEAASRLQSPAVDVDEVAAQAARETFLNNAILNEILNEKKKALFESEEILSLLREKIKAIQ